MRSYFQKVLSGILVLTVVATLPAMAGNSSVPQTPENVNPVEMGSEAPNVSVHTAEGKEVTLSSLLDGKPSVIVFYRGGWCPYCNKHLSALVEVEPELQELGYQILAISADSPESVRESLKESDFSYQLISDAPMKAAKAFGLAFRVDEETYAQLLDYGINLEEASGKDHHLLPVPAVFIVDDSGKISFRYYNPDYKERLSSQKLLKAARK